MMKEKINIAELLKECPTGMELDCTMFDDVRFDYIDNVSDIINCYIQNSNHKTGISFNKYGHYLRHDKAKCVIFPKGKTTWEGFVPPCRFKDGDVVVAEADKVIQMFILKEIKYQYQYHGDDSYVGYCYFGWDFNSKKLFPEGFRSFSRLATEREKEKLFKAIEEHGYKWNPESKTLEKSVKPRFKVGDRIVDKLGLYSPTLIKSVSDEYYGLELPNNIGVMSVKDQDDWVLVPDKFDITTLKPFESKVLVRDFNNGIWKGAIFGRYDGKKFFTIGGLDWRCCIPYEGNEHLYVTTNDCDDYYKTWDS